MPLGRLTLSLLIASSSILLAAGAQAGPEITVEPDTAQPGDSIKAVGAGFQPGTVELFWDTVGGATLGIVTPDRTGSFSTEFVVPAAKPGPHNVMACRDRNRTTNECREVVRDVLTIPAPPTTTTLPPSTTTSTSRPPATTTTAPPTQTTTTQPPIGVSTTSTTTTTRQPPIGVVTTTTAAPIPGDVAVTSTTLGGDPGAPRLPGSLTSPTVTTFPPEGIPSQIANLQITAVEVTQGLQNLANEFPLVENRWTAVRIHGLTDAEIKTDISGAVEVIRLAPTNENLGIVHASNIATYVDIGLDRVDINGSPYVLLEPEVAHGTVLIRAWIYANGDVDASNEPTAADNLFEVTVNFHEVEPVHMYYWPLFLEEDFEPDGDPVIWMPNDGYLSEHLAAYRLWPVNVFFAHPMNTVIGNAESDFNLNFDAEDSAAANVELKEMWELNNYSGFHIYTGMVSPGFAEATSPYKGRASAGTTWTMMGFGYNGAYPFHHRSGATLTHESGHFFGLGHAPCSFTVGNPIPNEVPGGAIDPTFPGSYGWPNCSLAPTDAVGYYGVDVLWEVTPAAGPTIMSNNAGHEAPNVAFPFMGYNAPKWLDPWHGCFIIDQLGAACDQEADTGVFDPTAPGGGGIPQPASGIPVWTCQDVLSEIDMCTYYPTPDGNPIDSHPDNDWLVRIALDVSDPTAPTARLEAMRVDSGSTHDHHELEGRADLGGPYVLALVDDQETAIWAMTLHVEDEGIDVPGDLGNHLMFLERVPALEEGVALAIVSPSGELARLMPTASPPNISITDVRDGESLSIRYDVDDPDGDTVRTVAMYRPDTSAPWSPVLPSTIRNHIDLADTTDLPGSTSGELRLIASDGWHTTETFIGGITIPDHAPSLTLVQPATDAAPAGRPVRLEVQAFDAEDGMLDGEAVAWTSSLDGPIATGAGLTTHDLSIGRHVITVVATDSAGNDATAAADLEIGPSDLPGRDVQSALSEVFAGGAPTTDTDGPSADALGDAGATEDPSGVPGVVTVMVLVGVGLGGAALWRFRRRLV